MIDYNSIPKITLETLDNWVLDALPPGSFGMALLEHDLMEVFKTGDEDNLANLQSIVDYLYNVLPMSCQGRRFREWKGLREEIGDKAEEWWNERKAKWIENV